MGKTNRSVTGCSFTGLSFCESLDNQRIHSHGPGTAIDDVDAVFARGETTYLKNRLLCLPCSGGGQVHCRAALAVNLNLNLAGPRFFWSDDRQSGAGERTAPEISRRVAGGEVVVEVAGTQVAAAHPAGGDHA